MHIRPLLTIIVLTGMLTLNACGVRDSLHLPEEATTTENSNTP